MWIDKYYNIYHKKQGKSYRHYTNASWSRNVFSTIGLSVRPSLCQNVEEILS